MDIKTSAVRKFYRKENTSKIMFLYKGKSYSGSISNLGTDGFEIMLEEKIDITRSAEMPILYFGKIDNNHAIEGIQVTDIKTNQLNGLTFIDVIPSNPKAEKQYSHILRKFVSKDNRTASDIPMADKIPSFMGKRHYSSEAINARQKWIQKHTNAALDNINQSIFNSNPVALAGNIENYIGAVQIPLGIAGPVNVKGSYIDGYAVIPIATSEGALISSITRGARACNEAGGVNVHVNHQYMLRAPVFLCKDIHGALMLEHWVNLNFQRIKFKAESVSSVAKLIRINTSVFGDSLHLQFFYNTADAAGQNMTTSCTWIACEWIAKQIEKNPHIKYESYFIEGNMSGDKKINFRSFTGGRGISVIASVYIPEVILKKVLRVSADHYMRLWYSGEYGGLQTGMMGYNINFANVIAGIFTATGQDIACVHESSVGILKARKQGDGIVFNAHLPNLVIGTVGGGTSLPAQRECLEMMNCCGQGNVYKLAEIITAACIALDISTSAAVCANEFVKAHEILGRKKAKKGIVRSDISNSFFNNIIGDLKGRVVSFESLSLDTNSGIINTLLKDKPKDFKGLFRYLLTIEDKQHSESKRVVLKIKSDSADLTELGAGISRLSGEDRLPGLFEAQLHIFGFDNTHIRELEFYRSIHPTISQFCPKILGTLRDDSRGTYAVLMEDLTNFSNIDTVNHPELWTKKAIENVLADLSQIHSIYFNKYEAVPDLMLINTIEVNTMTDAADFLKELLHYNHTRYPHLINNSLYNICNSFIDNMHFYLGQMDRYFKTLTHNDFNTRNICMRNADNSGLVVYDWELACFQNPQYDVIEFLVYALCENIDINDFDYYIEYYRKSLENECNITLDKESFEHIMVLNALKLCTVRFSLYLLVHNVCSFTFMDRIFTNLSSYLQKKADKLNCSVQADINSVSLIAK